MMGRRTPPTAAAVAPRSTAHTPRGPHSRRDQEHSMVAMVQPLVPVVLVALLQLVTSLSLFDAKQDLHVVPERNRKVWRRSLLFSNPDNWEGGALPCPGDKLVFPRDLRDSAAYLAAGERVTPPLEVREVELPWHGVVVLGHPGQGDRGRAGDSGQLRSSSGLVIGGEDSRSRSCPGRDVRWRLTTPSSWLDPDSWEPDGPPADPRDLEAVPHLERIPCGQDVAVFRDKAFRVVVPDFPVRAAALAFEGTVYTSGMGWLLGILLRDAMLSRTYFTQLPTKLMASSVEQVSSLAEQCGLGVEEGADERHVERAGQLAADELMAGVCLHVTCPVPRCAAPVRPHLHCCFVCGAVLELRPVPDRADLDRMRQVLRSEALRYETRWGAGAAPGVHLGVVPSPSGGRGLAQVVFVGENAEDMAAIILADIQSIVSADEARLLVSGAMIAPASVGSVLGVLVGSLFVVLVAMAAMVYFHYGALPLPSRLEGLFLNEKQTSFLFARFENTPEESGAVVSVLGRPQQPGVRSARGSWSARSFRNPLYEQGQSDEDAAPPPPPRGVAHENPLFSALREKLDGSSEHDEEGDQRQGDDTTLGVNLVDITL